MPTREQLKERAKMTFRANYGNCVATFLIAMLLIGVSFYTGIGAILVAIPLELGLLCYFLMVFQGAVPDLPLSLQPVLQLITGVKLAVCFGWGFGHSYGRCSLLFQELLSSIPMQ